MFYKVTEKYQGERLDKYLSFCIPEKSRNYISILISEGKVSVNGKTINKASYKLSVEDSVEVELKENVPVSIEKEDIALKIIYEDSDIIIIDKEQGMVVHPAPGHYEHTLVNALLAHCSDLSGINGELRPGIVHRIDKDTSGLICIAKNDDAHQILSAQLKDHTMARTYMALVRGVIKENSGTINLPIGRDKNNRQKMAVTRENSKAAITNFKVVERFKNHTLVECRLVTGRTHQIRVHFAYIGFPVEGDPLYGGNNYDALYSGGQLLTAVGLTLIHPTTKKELSFKTELPDYFENILKELRD